MNTNTSALRPFLETQSQDPNRISRRSFLGTTAAAVGTVSAGWLAAGGLNASAAEETEAKLTKQIRVGMMTAPVSRLGLDEALAMAQRCGMVALEVMAGPGSKLLDTAHFNQADADAVKQN